MAQETTLDFLSRPQTDRLAGKVGITSDLRIGIAEVLRGSMNFLSKDEPEHHNTDHLKEEEAVVVCWLLNVPATCKCISGTDLLRQFYVLPH